jgi:hypothetical protein
MIGVDEDCEPSSSTDMRTNWFITNGWDDVVTLYLVARMLIDNKAALLALAPRWNAERKSQALITFF